jgi:FkbM family methyltransferase
MKFLRPLAAVLASLLARSINKRHYALDAHEWRHLGLSFSQIGEDRLIRHLLSERRGPRGIYVDIGAFDPARYSNTLLLHKAGWRGINVDPNPEAIERFNAARPEDINVCAAASDREKPVEYLLYAGVATNRIVEPGGKESSVLGEAPLRRIPMTTRTLSSFLEEHATGAGIDLLNVDCEGEDLKVLQGLDWQRWRPYLVCVEAHGSADRDEVSAFLVERGYELVGRMLVTLVFRRTS